MTRGGEVYLHHTFIENTGYFFLRFTCSTLNPGVGEWASHRVNKEFMGLVVALFLETRLAHVEICAFRADKMLSINR
jgi:hypothetical protein